MSRHRTPLFQWQKAAYCKRKEEALTAPVLYQHRGIEARAADLDPSPPRRQWLLRVETDFFVAGAVWEKIGGVWSCRRAAPILRWMVGKSPEAVGRELLKMGAKHQFLRLRHGASHGVTA